MYNILPINELYSAVQGEGSRAGRPTIVIRFLGCTHSCYFGEEGGWCDSWFSSIHPEKGKYCLNDIYKIYENNPHIKDMMITGGSPSMHIDILNNLLLFASKCQIFVTIETEGSHKITTQERADLLSISPKFSNSIPKIGIKTPLGLEVDEHMVKRHNKYRCNYDVIRWNILMHKDYHYKPVWDGSPKILDEIEEFRKRLNIPLHKTWMMPAGDNRESLLKMYPIVMNKCVDMGYNFTGRPHIIAFDKARLV